MLSITDIVIGCPPHSSVHNKDLIDPNLCEKVKAARVVFRGQRTRSLWNREWKPIEGVQIRFRNEALDHSCQKRLAQAGGQPFDLQKAQTLHGYQVKVG